MIVQFGSLQMAMVLAGMPMPELTEIAKLRLDTISFFLLLMVLGTLAIQTRVPLYETPFPAMPTTRESRALTHQTGNAAIFADPSVRRFRDIHDGLANTIYSGGAAGSYAAWAHPANWRDPGRGINQSPDGFGGPFHGGCHVAMADGAVIFITDSIDPQLLRALTTPAGNEEVTEQ